MVQGLARYCERENVARFFLWARQLLWHMASDVKNTLRVKYLLLEITTSHTRLISNLSLPLSTS